MLEAIWMVALLSQYSEAVVVGRPCKSQSIEEIQNNSETVVAMAPYSTSVEDLDSVSYF